MRRASTTSSRELGSATVFEASGREGLIDLDLHQVIPGSRVAGPARTVRCAQDDILMVHVAMDRIEAGDVLVLTMPSPEPVALLGELLATQAKVKGAAAVLIDAAVRDTEELRDLGLPVWARWIRVQGAERAEVGEVGAPIVEPRLEMRRGRRRRTPDDGHARVSGPTRTEASQIRGR